MKTKARQWAHFHFVSDSHISLSSIAPNSSSRVVSDVYRSRIAPNARSKWIMQPMLLVALFSFAIADSNSLHWGHHLPISYSFFTFFCTSFFYTNNDVRGHLPIIGKPKNMLHPGGPEVGLTLLRTRTPHATNSSFVSNSYVNWS